ncbi:uncharacterized protein [Rutidosis leptorrhynchoides]|uniref:uncharacterized protein n=1 Tax=Rutidosis leptorrhynchoides TaxID=125765 RepID=UPI003A9A276E
MQNNKPFYNVDDADEFVVIDEDARIKLGEFNKKYPQHDPNVHWKSMRPRKGEKFANVSEFKIVSLVMLSVMVINFILRKVIGLDGCFLKGIAIGQLLSALGKDANNQVYPLAWAVVDGLIEAVRVILSNGEHRQCARHVYGNFAKRWGGLQFKQLFWAAAKCTYEEKFVFIMQKIKDINEEAYHHFADKRPAFCSRAFYRSSFDCDAVENEISECWNSMIKDARAKPIISMSEDIRIKVMSRLVDQRKVADKWAHDVCPTIRIKIQTNERLQRKWIVWASGIQEYEIRTISNEEVFTVNLLERTCSCRGLQISGISCPHAIAAQYHVGHNIEDLVSENLKKQKFIIAYS